jgi:hypothetical protein
LSVHLVNRDKRRKLVIPKVWLYRPSFNLASSIVMPVILGGPVSLVGSLNRSCVHQYFPPSKMVGALSWQLSIASHLLSAWFKTIWVCVVRNDLVSTKVGNVGSGSLKCMVNGCFAGILVGKTALRKHDCLWESFCKSSKECCDFACGCRTGRET